MRLLLIFFIALLLQSFAGGCRRAESSSRFSPWESDNVESDSLMWKLDREMDTFPKLDRVISVILQLDSLGKATKDSTVLARVAFAKARIHHSASPTPFLDAFAKAEDIYTALDLIDSVKHPYDFARFRQLYVHGLYRDLPLRAKVLSENVRIFTNAKDSFRASEAYNHIAAIFEYYNDIPSAIDMYSKARSMLNKSQEFPLFINDFNRAILYLYHPDIENYTDSAKMLMARLLKNRMNKSNPRSYSTVLEDNYIFSGDVNLLYASFDFMHKDYVVNSRWYDPARAAAMLADYHLQHGNLDSAAWYAKISRATVYYFNQGNEEVPQALANYYTSIGMKDSADFFLKKIDSVDMSRKALENSARLQRIKNQEQLQEFTNMLTSEQESSSRTLWIVVVVVLIAAAVTTVLIVRHHHRASHSEKEVLRDSLDSKQRELAVARMKLAESNSDWNEFSMIFAQINPNFIETLTTEYPALSQGELRLCCLTLLGVETKEIARIMSINPDSVKKNRHRLRVKLGIDPSIPLDAFLRDTASRARSQRPS